jgi:hypothetical protein
LETLFMQKAKHAPETCPAYDAKFKKMTVNWYEKVDSLAAKNGVKVIGVLNDHGAHEVYAVYEAPSIQNMMGFMMEPENQAMLSFNTSLPGPSVQRERDPGHGQEVARANDKPLVLLPAVMTGYMPLQPCPAADPS